MKHCRAALLLCLVLSLLLCGCGGAGPAGNAPVAGTKTFPTFEYTHYASGGTPEPYTAVILFEQSCSTFTSYQVAYSSCTCRDSLVNYYAVCYVEILNTRKTAGDAAIRAISFGDNKGLYGDSNPNYYRHDYTEEYMDENLIQRFVGMTKDDLSAWGGYGTFVDGIDVDAVTGATVTTSNLTSMLQQLFEYHTAKYYAE